MHILLDKKCQCLIHLLLCLFQFGTKAPCGRYPYMASLRDRKNKHICGGVLVKPEWVLTSASCVDFNANPSPPEDQAAVVVVGACNLDDELNERNEGNVTVEAS